MRELWVLRATLFQESDFGKNILIVPCPASLPTGCSWPLASRRRDGEHEATQVTHIRQAVPIQDASGRT